MPLTLVAALFAAILVVACSAPPAAPVAPSTAAETWRTATLRDVLGGEDFAIRDLEGKVVVIEPMAIWCVNCRFQQHEAQLALEELGSNDVVYVSLDIDPRERASDLAAYAQREGFDWRFVVASPDVSRSLAASFGDQVLSPPATPLVVLAPDGRVVEQHVGVRSADALVALIQQHLP